MKLKYFSVILFVLLLFFISSVSAMSLDDSSYDEFDSSVVDSSDTVVDDSMDVDLDDSDFKYSNSDDSSICVDDLDDDVGYDYCSCQESDLRWQMIREHVYSRWIDYGSVYGITEYSMTFAATETVPDYLIDNFLTIYIDLAKLVLLQRAAIISLEARVAAYAAGDKIEKPIEIWRDYIYFQTSMMLPEASFQQQGVEMYDMLWKCLQIQRYSDYLGNEIHSFSEHARFVNDKQDEERDKRASHFSLIISIILAFSLFNDAYEGVRAIINANIKSFKDVFSHVPIVVAGILVVAIIILSLCVLIIGQNKKGRDKT